MTKEEIKTLVRDRLSTRRIILFVSGESVEAFYQEHKDVWSISHCVSNIPGECGEGAFLGELDVRKYRREDLEENDYIVVCDSLAFQEIELQLAEEGLRMYDDFIESSIARVIWQNKKIALFYGQCILRDIYKCLVRVPAFEKEYASVFTQTMKDQLIVINRLLYHIKDVCDLYVYTPKILDRDSAYSLSPEQLPPECKIISVSNLTFSVYWPQINEDNAKYNPFYLHPYHADRDMVFYHTLYRREDCNINRMLLEGKTVREIVDCLSSDGFYSEKQVKKNARIAFKLIDAAEYGTDVNIMDDLQENYRRIMLYQNFAHPNKQVLWEYTRRLLKAIDTTADEVDLLEARSPMHIHEGGDVPIYPSVAKALGLEFADASTKYEIMTGNGLVPMTFREYTEHLAEYTQKTMEMIGMW